LSLFSTRRERVEGVIAIDKPAGCSSFDVLRVIKRTWGEKRLGHCGTLDPNATGVLVVCLGWSTRLVPWLQASTKEYVGTVQLGVRTASDDPDGEVVERREVPPLTATEIDRALQRLTGTISQVPPNFSALRVDGRRAFDLARSGEDFELGAREITVHAAELVSWDRLTASFVARWSVSKGTYIRSLARDLGEALGCGAHLSTLRRTRSGAFDVRDCVSMAEFERDPAGVAATRIVTPWDALGDLPTLEIDEFSRQWLVQGKRPHWFGEPLTGEMRVADANGELLGIVTDFVDETGQRRLISERIRPGTAV
jgi:tRNA pseudouridine55 synthase